MLPITHNPNFSTIENAKTEYNTNVDMNGRQCTSEVFGVDAINQSIENLICTLPGERLFNVGFYSPLYEILFDNYSDGLEEQIFTQIELFIPIRVNRQEALFKFNAVSHVLSISIPWTMNDGSLSAVFTRVIGR